MFVVITNQFKSSRVESSQDESSQVKLWTGETGQITTLTILWLDSKQFELYYASTLHDLNQTLMPPVWTYVQWENCMNQLCLSLHQLSFIYSPMGSKIWAVVGSLHMCEPAHAKFYKDKRCCNSTFNKSKTVAEDMTLRCERPTLHWKPQIGSAVIGQVIS